VADMTIVLGADQYPEYINGAATFTARLAAGDIHLERVFSGADLVSDPRQGARLGRGSRALGRSHALARTVDTFERHYASLVAARRGSGLSERHPAMAA
jgi:hypothetical protein